MPTCRSLLLAVPTTGQTMKSATAITIASTVKVLQAAGIDVDLHNIDSAEIVTARDMFANMVLHSDKWEALLFIDSDMGFDPRLVLRMVELNTGVAAAAYPRRTFNLDQFMDSVRQHGDRRKAIAEASDFTLKLGWNDETSARLQIVNGFCALAAVGMGCALIAKSALQAMIDAKVVEPRLDLHMESGQTCWSFFDNLIADGTRLGEDYSFCHRWTSQMGRELWVCVDEDVRHIGSYDYTARFSDLLTIEPAPPVKF
jgi:hypothetical protein